MAQPNTLAGEPSWSSEHWCISKAHADMRTTIDWWSWRFNANAHWQCPIFDGSLLMSGSLNTSLRNSSLTIKTAYGQLQLQCRLVRRTRRVVHQW